MDYSKTSEVLKNNEGFAAQIIAPSIIKKMKNRNITVAAFYILFIPAYFTSSNSASVTFSVFAPASPCG